MGSAPDLETARYSQMRWNTPLSEEHADALIASLDARGAKSVLDLGCGWAEFMIRVLRDTSVECSGVGVDTDATLLKRAADSVADDEIRQRIRFVECPAAEWSAPADRVICIGASHAWDDTVSALRALRKLVAPGGRLLFGEGCWEREPTAGALAIFGDSVLSLPDLVAQASDAGWRVLGLTVADQREWDDFESGWRLGREQWLLAHPDDPRAEQVRQELDDQVREYVSEYRGVLGFCYLVLGS